MSTPPFLLPQDHVIIVSWNTLHPPPLFPSLSLLLLISFLVSVETRKLVHIYDLYFSSSGGGPWVKDNTGTKKKVAVVWCSLVGPKEGFDSYMLFMSSK
ncbi:hypothetical protein VNO77_39621 [Canavalia gladiata]|uniref:Uncharacterized protein n=1 Tax=Canavalia gladiata TaxID=3824 RepID=A0AAN9PQW5_CANGL